MKYCWAYVRAKFKMSFASIFEHPRGVRTIRLFMTSTKGPTRELNTADSGIASKVDIGPIVAAIRV